MPRSRSGSPVAHHLAAPPDVSAGTGRAVDDDRLAAAVGLLDRDHPVAAPGHHGAGHDLGRLAVAELDLRRPARRHRGADRQGGAGLDVAADHVAVHRRDVGGGHVDFGGDRGRQHPPRRRDSRPLFRRQRLEAFGDQASRRLQVSAFVPSGAILSRSPPPPSGGPTTARRDPPARRRPECRRIPQQKPDGKQLSIPRDAGRDGAQRDVRQHLPSPGAGSVRDLPRRQAEADLHQQRQRHPRLVDRPGRSPGGPSLPHRQADPRAADRDHPAARGDRQAPRPDPDRGGHAVARRALPGDPRPGGVDRLERLRLADRRGDLQDRRVPTSR